jgi:serine/threonine protein kinase
MAIDDKTLIASPSEKKTNTPPAFEEVTVLAQSDPDKESATVIKKSIPVGSPIDESTVFSSSKQVPNPSRVPQGAKQIATSVVEAVNHDATVFSSAGTPNFSSAVSSSETSVTKTIINGRFELDELLGEGGMGVVYKALDRRKVEANDSAPFVAIKVLNDDFKQHPDAFISLQREAQKSQTLAHPNIVTVFDFDRDDEMVFMTMEFLDGAPLDELLREHVDTGLEEDEAYKLLRDISQALIYAHSHGIIHSDFKPGNIFATKTKGAKVFDFGIARAVSSGGLGEVVGDFDAGSLGALTPAYASMEMLNGENPSPSDDVYALGCVAYELYTGSHPFRKVPADKAFAQKLKAKRIKCLSRRQWRALEASLEFSLDKRTASVEEFVKQFFGRSRAIMYSIIFVSALITVLGSAFYVSEEKKNSIVYRAELQKQQENELSLLRISDKKEEIKRLSARNTLSSDSNIDIKKELEAYTQLAPEDNIFPEEISSGIVDKFVKAAAEFSQGDKLDDADIMLDLAGEWGPLSAQASIILNAVTQKRDKIEQRKKADRLEAEERRAASILEAKQKAEVARLAQVRSKVAAEAQARDKQYNQLLDKIGTSIKCDFDMDISGALTNNMVELQAFDASEFQIIKPVVANLLTDCINQLASTSPTRAAPLLKQSQALLPNQAVLTGLKLDSCSHLEPGSGGKSERNNCQDQLVGGGFSPQLVVTEGESKKRIGIGRYEVSFNDLKPYCINNSACSVVELLGDQPANNISVKVAKGYLEWLSQQTGYVYRLPSYREWFAAASADGEGEQANRNCRLKFGSTNKGIELVGIKTGKNNKYGLVNHVGNVQEWVFDDAKELMVAGGHRQDPMSRCLATTQKTHDGGADQFTGFRIVRDISKIAVSKITTM